jgi:hypothetical protein
LVFVFVIFLLLWGGLHVYIAERLLSIPVIAQYLPPHILVPLVVFLGVSYIASRVMEHYELGRLSHVLEYVGATWVGIFFLVFVALFAADVVTGFGWLLPALKIKIRVGALLVAAVLIVIAYVQAWRIPTVTEYEVALRGLPGEVGGKVLVVGSDLHLGSMLGHRSLRCSGLTSCYWLAIFLRARKKRMRGGSRCCGSSEPRWVCSQ